MVDLLRTFAADDEIAQYGIAYTEMKNKSSVRFASNIFPEAVSRIPEDAS